MMRKGNKRTKVQRSEQSWKRWATRMGLVASALILAPLAGDDVIAQRQGSGNPMACTQRDPIDRKPKTLIRWSWNTGVRHPLVRQRLIKRRMPVAEIPVEKKNNLTWLWIVLAIIVAALLLW